jgi:hypothetical protein
MAGKAAIPGEAGERGIVAQILPVREAPGAMAAGPPEPGHADPFAGADDGPTIS